MTAIAIIPARGGSKGVPRKNLRKVGGKTLIRRCVETCIEAGCFERVIVSTDDITEIGGEAVEAGAFCVMRPQYLAGDECRSDPVLLHALMTYLDEQYLPEFGELPDVTAFVQCTAPLMTPEDLVGCVWSQSRLNKNSIGYDKRPDVTIQVVESHGYRLTFRHGAPYGIEGIGFDVSNLCARRQDRPSQYEIAGTIWAMDTLRFLERGKVYSENVAIHVTQTPKLDIDTEADLRMAELLLSQRTETPDVPVPDWYEYVGME